MSNQEELGDSGDAEQGGGGSLGPEEPKGQGRGRSEATTTVILNAEGDRAQTPKRGFHTG